MANLNSRQKRRNKVGFKGVGTHKCFGIGFHPRDFIEAAKGSYNMEANRTNPANKAYANLVHAAIKNNLTYKVDVNGNLIHNSRTSKHIGSRPYNIIKKVANLE